jgi:hypothetical protein
MISNQARKSYNYLDGVESLQMSLSAIIDKYVVRGSARLSEHRIQIVIESIGKRLENLTKTHEEVMALYISEIFKRSFLHLQSRHVESIGSEIKKVFKYLRTSCLNPCVDLTCSQ